MVDQNTQFYAILTNVGAAKQANADALGIAWKITQMGLGDANGTDPTPNATQTALLNEWRRAPLNQLKVDDKDASIIVAEQVIPAEVGGHWIREIGLYDADGDLVAVANCAPTYKPLLNQGSGRTQVVRMSLVVSSASNVQLKIDPSVVLATREFVIEELARQDFKHSVLVATTAAITLSGLQAVDGVTLTAGARVLVKNQAAGKDNGLYLVAVGGWTRCSDADTNAKVTPGLLVLVERGTANGDSAWQLVTDAPIALGVTALSFEMAFGRTGVAAGTYRSVTVDKYGRVVSATNPTTVAGYGLTDVYTKAELDTALAAKAPMASPKFTGLPETTTPLAGDNSQRIANTAFVKAAIEALVAAAPGALDTLSELAAAIGSDPNFAVTMTSALASKAPLKDPTFTGNPKAPTPAITSNDVSLATTQFVQSLFGVIGWGPAGISGGAIAAGTNLNTMLTPGSFGQPSNGGATLALNYPEALAGTLLVQAAGAGLVTQKYSVRGPLNREWSRNFYGLVWSDWTEAAQVESPILRGLPKAPTAAVGTNTVQLATTEFIYAVLNALGLGNVGTGLAMPDLDDATVVSGIYYVNGSTLNQAYSGAHGTILHKVYGGGGFQLMSPLGASRVLWRRRTGGVWQKWEEFANLDSPAFTGSPTAPTPLKGNSSKLLATTEFVQVAVAALVDSAPGTLDTLKELAASLANDPNFATTMANQLAGKAPVVHSHLVTDITNLGLAIGSSTQDPNESLNYIVLSKHANAPDTLNYWYITTTFYSGVTMAANRGQVARQYSGGNAVYARNFIAGVWSGWERLDAGVDTGAVVYFAGNTAPRGFIKANGAAVSRTAYAALFAAIGTSYGAGNGSTTFNVPDLRGEFVRGLDDGRNIDTGRGLGSWQDSQNLSHTHAASASVDAHAHSVSGSTNSSGAHAHNMTANGGQYASETQPYGAYRGNGVTSVDSSAIKESGAHTHTISGSTNSVSHSHTITVAAEGGNEARPRNIALLAFIKF